jgi:hypothetical protein
MPLNCDNYWRYYQHMEKLKHILTDGKMDRSYYFTQDFFIAHDQFIPQKPVHIPEQ